MNSCIDNCCLECEGGEKFNDCNIDIEYRIEKRVFGSIVCSYTVNCFKLAKEIYKSLDDTHFEESSTFCPSAILLFINGVRMKMPKAESLIYTIKERQKTFSLRKGREGSQYEKR